MRVTHVYRREGSEWLLVHRHADPLVPAIDMEQIATLARGDKLRRLPGARHDVCAGPLRRGRGRRTGPADSPRRRGPDHRHVAGTARHLPAVPLRPDGRRTRPHCSDPASNHDQRRHEVLGDALVVVRGPDAYVSPSWYAAKAEHGRVVPTWNYLAAHVYGRLVADDDPLWVEDLVRRRTERHEASRATALGG